MAKKNKSKKSVSDKIRNFNYLKNDDIQKDSILLRNLSLFTILLTALIYISAYICEVITAICYGFDIDLISLSMSTLIKNNIVCLLLIIPSMLPILFDYLRNHQKSSSNVKQVVKNYYIFIITTIVVILSIVVYKFNQFIFYKLFLPVVIILVSILLFIYFFLKLICSMNFIQLFYYLFFWVFLFIILVAITFFNFILTANKPYQIFSYDNQNYALLRRYDNSLVAKKIITKEQNGQEKNYFYDEILYLPIATLKKGLLFRIVKVENDSN